jgi:hypothetical protein
VTKTTNYRDEARTDAWAMAEEFVDEMCEQWQRGSEVSNDLFNDYPNGDEYHHSNHVDKDYNLTEAAALLSELSDYEEDDNGLWEGLEPRRAIAAQAAYTYGNAVYDLWRSLVVEELNGYLDSLSDTLPEVEDEDAAEAARLQTGERLIRVFVILGDDLDHSHGEEAQLIRSAWESLQQGEATGVGALADWYDEHDKGYRAKQLRAAVGI